MPLPKEVKELIDAAYPIPAEVNENTYSDYADGMNKRHAAEYGYYLGLATAVDKIAKDAWNAAADFYKGTGAGGSYSEWLKKYKKNY